MQTAVEVKSFGKRFKKTIAVEDVSLTIQSGEIYGLIGPDGAGKSTLMQAVSGVLRFEKGEITVFGEKIDSEASANRIKRQLGFMPQGLGLNLYPDLSIDENIDFFANLRGVAPEILHTRKAKLLDVAGLSSFKNRAMKNLSGGMKQKLGLVCTLIHQPRLLILDEPTTGVDPVSRRDFWEMLNQLVREEGMTALISTAYMDEASRFNRLSMMHQGKVLDQGTADEIIRRTPGWLIEIESARSRELLPALNDAFEHVEELGDMIRIGGFALQSAEAERRLGMILQDGTESWSYSPIGLEEIFIQKLDNRSQNTPQMRLTENRSSHRKEAVSTDSQDTLIRAEDLVRRFDSFTAVDQVSFDVRAGEIFGLLGANGAGKSTVIKMLTGILPPSGGAGFVAGHNMATSSMSIKESIGYMSQAFSLYLDLTVSENIDLFGRIYGLSGKRLKERHQWVLQIGHLQKECNTSAGSLPMGKRQRLALGCALIHQPKVLFLDEPTSGVDPIGRREFWRILVQLAGELQVAILVTTHYMLEAEHCNRLALMQAGKVVAYDSPKNLKATLKQQKGQVLSLKVSRPYQAQSILESNGYSEVALYGSRVRLFSQEPETVGKDVAALLADKGIEITDVMILQPSLEDVFIEKIESSHSREA
ncbi:ATP-binding cassette domain-containing protein [Thiomicrorhabdus sp. 6S3-12]|uniref:ATP-binding cassette domain-containing protein n=1 Tax=Thiomicrorhabdus sp. 6S3-12 TaxID=2819681 RepID=UPI001AADC013|nr:ATP-binding cassette domain-containing protein [Thiomicrorhabdus sp. 6S3-12]MBO1923996.1 ATP-binding cassette domain-containing protein [Thiomicrorhabdus sp. 6S3-12]